MIFIHSAATAQTASIADTGVLQTVRGIGGWVATQYDFSKGDSIVVHYKASKTLDHAVAILDNRELCKVRGGKGNDMDFVMPEDGVVNFLWISDRGGVNTINYTLTYFPAKKSQYVKQRFILVP